MVKKRQDEWKERLERRGSERCTKPKEYLEQLWREDQEGDPDYDGNFKNRIYRESERDRYIYRSNCYASQYAWHGIRYVRMTSCL